MGWLVKALRRQLAMLTIQLSLSCVVVLNWTLLANRQSLEIFSEMRRSMKSISLQRKWVEFMQTIRFLQILFYDNIVVQSNVIHASYLNNVQKLLFLGSSCIYPKDTIQPMTEDKLLTGPLGADQ